MKKTIAIALAALTLGAASFSTTAAEARDNRHHVTQGKQHHVWRHASRHHDGRHYGSRHYRGRHYGYRYGGWRGHDNNGAVAAGILGGIAAGALIGGAVQAQDAPPCVHYRSYDPGSRTFVGRDGVRYACR